jgi:hypothetical protein
MVSNEKLIIYEIEMALRSVCEYSPKSDYGYFRSFYYKFLLCLSKIKL